MNEFLNKSDISEALPETLIVESILDAVAEQRLPAGTKLVEKNLSDLFECNRANVRRALTALAAQHVVELRPNRGAYIATPSPQKAHEVFEARRAIERSLARLAIPKVQDVDIAYLRQNVKDETVARDNNDRPSELRLSRQFHMRFATIVGNSVLEDYLSDLTLRSTLILGLYSAGEMPNCAENEHALIIDQLEQRNENRLVELVNEHLHHLESALVFSSAADEDLSLAERLNI